MDKILIVFCSILSCSIINEILFQFMENRYKKNFKKMYLYILARIMIVFSITFINFFNISILNLGCWCFITGISVYFLYYEETEKPLHRILECETLLFCMSICEALGAILLQWFLQGKGMNEINSVMLPCFEIIFSKIIVIFFYYLVINRFMKKQAIPNYKTQYYIYIVMLLYSFINMLVVIEISVQGEISYLSVINMVCIVLVDLYFLHFINLTNEKNYYENQVKILEQQVNIQYEYYQTQMKKYDQTVQILHDVKKHIKVIQELYAKDKKNIADKYTGEIGDMLSPLIPMKYTGNTILNILLADKKIMMKEVGITFEIKIENINLDFLEPMDVTTIFGNLLDNAIEATEKVEGEKDIFMKFTSYHEMIVVQIENSCNDVKWKNGFPVSEKGKNRGIGLLNVKNSIGKYDGDLILKQEKNKFIVKFFLNA